MERTLRQFLRGLADLLFPCACAGCGRALEGDVVLCVGCDASLIRIPARACVLCQELEAPAPGAVCASCRAHPTPHAACVAAVRFSGMATRWIHHFKYPRGGLSGLDPGPGAVASVLVREAARRLPNPPPDAVVPVPLHPRRLRRRGFNPAGILARTLARELRVPLLVGTLLRLRDTPSQTDLDRAARVRNMDGAFGLRKGAPLPERIWLVDDVVTTGSTLAEAGRVLRRGGVREVLAVCAARTPGAL